MAKFLRKIFGRYCFASGQSINLEKSAIYFGKEVDVRIQRRVSRFLVVHTSCMTIKYLGVFVDGKRIPL